MYLETRMEMYDWYRHIVEREFLSLEPKISSGKGLCLSEYPSKIPDSESPR
jgi:hypothetical protein